MKKYKLIIIMLGLVCWGQMVSAQGVVYEYDNAGNRTNRSLDVLKVLQPDSLFKDGVLSNVGVVDGEVVGGNTAENLNETIGDKTINIFPNPTEGVLQVNITNLGLEDKGEIRIYGVNGAELMRINSVKSNNTIDISDKPNGTYVMEVRFGDKRGVWKVVKK